MREVSAIDSPHYLFPLKPTFPILCWLLLLPTAPPFHKKRMACQTLNVILHPSRLFFFFPQYTCFSREKERKKRSKRKKQFRTRYLLLLITIIIFLFSRVRNLILLARSLRSDLNFSWCSEADARRKENPFVSVIGMTLAIAHIRSFSLSLWAAEKGAFYVLGTNGHASEGASAPEKKGESVSFSLSFSLFWRCPVRSFLIASLLFFLTYEHKPNRGFCAFKLF